MFFSNLYNWIYNTEEDNNKPTKTLETVVIPQQANELQSNLKLQQQQQQPNLSAPIVDQPIIYIDLTEDEDRVAPPQFVVDLTQDDSDDNDQDKSKYKARDVLGKSFLGLDKRARRTLRRLQKAEISKHNPSKPSKSFKPSKTALHIANVMETRCTECLIEYNQPFRDLTKRKSIGLCLGCNRMLAVVNHSPEEKEELTVWLRTGALKMSVWKDEIYNDNEEERIKGRALYMRFRLLSRPYLSERLKDFYSRKLPSEEELFKLYTDNQCKCAITGWTCHLPRYGKPRFWSVSLDHIVPVSIAPFSMNPWTIDNLQILSHVINQVKGNSNDQEVRQWYRDWLDAHP